MEQKQQPVQQTKSKSDFPSEEVTLPSKGILYPESSPLRKGVIEMKYMTAREEDILTNQNFIKKGTVIDKLLQSLIVTPGVDYNDLLIGDKNAILIAARILGYGSDYTVVITNPDTGEEEDVTIDLTESKDKELDPNLPIDGRNEFPLELPASKLNITFQLMTNRVERQIEQELKGLKKIDKYKSVELSTRLKHVITSINGDRDTKKIREFVDTKFLARDSRALRNEIQRISPDIDLKYDIEFENGHIQENVTIPITVNFFWPDTGV